MSKMLLTLVSLFLMNFSWANNLKLETQKGSIFIPELKDWELGKDMFGMPFMYFSPKSNGQRSNISFTATGAEVGQDLLKLSTDHETYKIMKNAWAEKVFAKTKGFIPYKKWQNSYGHTVHEIGFEYSHENKNYQEISFYVDCREKLIFAKSLRTEENKTHQESFTNLIKKMDCGA